MAPFTRVAWCSNSGLGWQEQGLFIFFLPPYCSEMNPIETQWRQLKGHENSWSGCFDNEYDLAMAVIDGMEARRYSRRICIEAFYI